MQKHRCYVLLMTVLILIYGCYIPTHEHGKGIIPEEVMNFLVPGKTTRADVLLKFGDPMQRIEKDRYFIYHWKIIDGYWAIGSTAVPSEEINYLCLEFTPDDLLKRWKHFEGGYLLNHPEKQVSEWLNDENTQ